MTFQVNTPKLTAKTKGQKITFELMVKVGQLRHSCLRFQVIIKKKKKKTPANQAEGGKMWLCCKTPKCWLKMVSVKQNKTQPVNVRFKDFIAFKSLQNASVCKPIFSLALWTLRLQSRLQSLQIQHSHFSFSLSFSSFFFFFFFFLSWWWWWSSGEWESLWRSKKSKLTLQYA